MHRTDLPGEQSRTAFLVVGRGGHVLAAERQGRGGHVRHVAQQPRRNDPRQTTAHRHHEPKQLSTRFLAMITRGFSTLRPIQVFLLLVFTSLRVAAQDQPPPMPPEHHHPGEAPAAAGWTWGTDANLFVGYDYQQRRFADFAAVESQNWFMAAGTRQVGRGRLTATGMLSLEPLTVGRLVYAGDGGM